MTSTVAANPVNAPLLERVLARIEERPDLLAQARWRVELPSGEVAYDVAGWTVILTGGAFVRRRDGSLDPLKVIPPGGGDPEWVWAYATRMLGIEHTREPLFLYPPLFYGFHTLADLRRIAAELIGAKGGA